MNSVQLERHDHGAVHRDRATIEFGRSEEPVTHCAYGLRIEAELSVERLRDARKLHRPLGIDDDVHRHVTLNNPAHRFVRVRRLDLSDELWWFDARRRE